MNPSEYEVRKLEIEDELELIVARAASGFKHPPSTVRMRELIEELNDLEKKYGDGPLYYIHGKG